MSRTTSRYRPGGVFHPEKEMHRTIKEGGKLDPPPEPYEESYDGAENFPTDELTQAEEEARKKRYEAAAKRYEMGRREKAPEFFPQTVVPPEEITELERLHKSKVETWEGDAERGHRHGEKPERPKGGESIRGRRAA